MELVNKVEDMVVARTPKNKESFFKFISVNDPQLPDLIPI